jgi:hypothetical protein
MKNTQKKSAQYWEAYKTRVQELEAEGLCTSDAQSVADVEFDESLKNVDEHTPGPWVVDFCNGKPYVVNGNFCAARVHGTEKTLLANARLIAAAPELLEACMVALAAIKSEYPLEHGNPTIGRAWGTLESAIEKATSNI